jgi:hypothetical protein
MVHIKHACFAKRALGFTVFFFRFLWPIGVERVDSLMVPEQNAPARKKVIPQIH